MPDRVRYVPPVRRRAASAFALLGVTCATLLACSGSGDGSSSSAPGAGSTGGSGSARVPTGLPVRILPRPRLSVGVTVGDTAQMFMRVVSPFLMHDGRLVVPDAGAGTARVFDAGGRLLTSLGREGDGPGEFRRLRAAWSRGDTIEALDASLNRITRFLPGNGTEVVTLGRGAEFGGALGDGWVAAGFRGFGADGRDDWGIEQYGRDGEPIRMITHVPGMLRLRVPALQGPGPLSPRQVFAIGKGRLYTGESLTPALEVWGPDGAPMDTITWRPSPSRSPKDVLSEVLDSARARSPRQPGTISPETWAAFPAPDRVSVFWDILVDPDGFVWVRPYRPLEDALPLGGQLGGVGGTQPGGTWMILAPTGGVVGSVKVPDALVPKQITEDAVVGIARDSLGVESVRVYPLERATG